MAARREVREELGFNIEVDRLLVVDWNPPGHLPDDGLMLIYLGSPIGDQQIRIAEDELSEWCWCTRVRARERLPDFKARRIIAGMDAYEQDRFVELEDGYPIVGNRWR